MAQLKGDVWGPKLELDESDTQTLLQADDVGVALAGLGVAAPPPLNAALGLFAAYIAANRAIVTAVDKGNGVWLTIPWPAIWWGQWWIIVPTTR